MLGLPAAAGAAAFPASAVVIVGKEAGSSKKARPPIRIFTVVVVASMSQISERWDLDG
jgi:hypothetical protein